MYQSLYRKYRPKTFDEVVGQKVIIKILKNEISKNKITHAYLFAGPRGTGKTSVAKILAKTINCYNLKDNLPCEKCVNCTQINQKQSIDIVEIDAASNNGVDEIRELKSKVSLVPSIGKYKVYIIDEVHMLTIGAFNALLKTLEEPPSHIVFILATTEPHKIPETILSRCQKFDFKKIDENSMEERLKHISKLEKISIESEAIKEIIRFSNGGMRDAISLLEQACVYSESSITINDVHEINGTLPQYQLKELINNIIDKNLIQIFKKLEEYDKNGKNPIKLVEEIILFLKNAIILKNVPDYSNKNISREIYIELTSKLTSNEILEMITKINNSIVEMKNYNNPKLVFELLMISLIVNSKEKTTKIQSNNEVKDSIPYINESSKEKDIESNSIKNVKNSILKLEKVTDNIENKEFLKKLTYIRVNNTLAKPSREILNKIKKNTEEFRDYILNKKYGKIASLLVDAKIPAANETNIIFVYSSNSMVNIFNNNLLKIESFIKKILKNEYKIISLSDKEWSEHRKEYKNKTKKYIYIEEDKSIGLFLKHQSEIKENEDEIHSLFGDIIEYDK
ncbi:MAG: DNA polymerase III subunit gamma/tau [Bacilli bacterium]|nr:DNA polymerase III subunit gamma/tau [Bacilli bacterium]MDD4282698.1 DNA polymerase III subunit gamma/tau [Bacilli bacterium]MDD4718237.1 DNA polymerase III subunit gamma/tau [Bacilli bacterium]